MAEAVLDTSVLVAALHGRDREHESGAHILRAADSNAIAPLVLTDLILAETMNYLVRKGGSHVARSALSHIEDSPGLHVERVPDRAYLTGKNRIFQEIDGLSFVDAITVAFMKQRGSNTIYSFDRDFDRVPGITRLDRPAK